MPVPPTDPQDPLYWPEAPLGAVIGPNLATEGPAFVWYVQGLPPIPWPNVPPDPHQYDSIPFYTLYHFSSPELAIRYAFSTALDPAAFAQGFARYHAPALIPNTQYAYRVDPPGGDIPVTSVELFRATVHAKLG